MENKSLCERLSDTLEGLFIKFRLPFLSGIILGLFAHGYCFTNKLLNADETAALFSKGADVTSGRWGLVLSGAIFPDMSMPWIYGIISVVLLSAAACVAVEAFALKSPLLKVLTAGAMLVFPAQTGTFCFMYTSAPYALAVLLAVLTVYLCKRGGKLRYVLACLFMALSLLIYQAYISITASFFIILLLQMLSEDDAETKKVIVTAVKYFAVLLVSLGIYLAITTVVKNVGGSGYQEYDTFAEGGILYRVRIAYSSFVRVFVSGYFGFVNSTLSLIAHIVCAAVVIAAAVTAIKKQRDLISSAVMVILLILFPLSINCLYIIASVDIIHSVSQFGFLSVYFLTAAAADSLIGRAVIWRDGAVGALAVIVICNIFFANEVYLKMFLEYENAYAFYNTLMMQVMETPGFNSETIIDIVGNESRTDYDLDRIDTKNLTGPNGNLVDSYTRCDFIKYYLGLDLYIYREDIIWADWFYDMPTYPDSGSIVMREDENRIIVKLS
ncbi:MAG: glucosyltransferase domain-containing protein [Eubacteriales bacterium]|nr:glucosyltransferase domain-containing protein [Eubacteriales bacterium]